MAPPPRRGSGECAVPPLEIGVQAVSLSPYRTGLAGPHRTRLPMSPAFPTCSCPLGLSPSGKSMTQEPPFELLLTVSRIQHRVPRRTLSPHTAQHLWSFSMDIHEASVPISPAPQCIPRGQLARSLGTFVPIFPKARGLRLQSSSWCAQLSWAPTTMPHPTPVRTSGISLGSRLPTLHFPSHSS